MNKTLDWIKCVVAKIVRPWIAELVIRGFIPERAGRYRILDMLLVWAEEDLNWIEN